METVERFVKCDLCGGLIDFHNQAATSHNQGETWHHGGFSRVSCLPCQPCKDAEEGKVIEAEIEVLRTVKPNAEE